MNYEQSNVGPGMVPHKKNCRCDECHLDRLQDRVATLEAERLELIKLVRKIRDWPHHSPMRAEAQRLAHEALAKINKENSDE